MALPNRPPVPPPTRPARRNLRIVLPALALVVAMGGLAAVWSVLSWRADQEIDAWLQREADLGRNWSCPQRAVEGFPFRIEVTCTDPSFTGKAEGRALTGRLAKIHTVAQIYDPNHVIAEFEGPLVVETADGERVEADWLLGRASIHGKPGAGLERLSAELTEPRVTLSGRAGTATMTAGLADFHIRKTPNRPVEDGAYDVASRVTRGAIPPLDRLIGSPGTTEADLVATITKAQPLAGRGLPVELERWRTEGGRVQVSTATFSHGPRRIDASGSIGLDEAHRPQGRLDVTVSGFDELLERLGFPGKGNVLGGLLAGVLGARPGTAPPSTGEKPGGAAAAPVKGVVLPLRLDGGRVFLGPIPLATLMPLY